MPTRILFPAVAALTLLAGLVMFRDYGVGFDEEMQRVANGLVNFAAIFGGEWDALYRGNEKNHGPLFELLLILGEKALGLEDSRGIYLFRHLATFLLFWTGCLAFYRLLARRLEPWAAALGTGLLFLTPRLLGDAFHNSKDIPFLAVTLIALLTLVRWLERPGSLGRAAVHGAACGALIDIRIPGVILPVLTVAAFLVDRLAGDRRAGWKAAGVFVATLAACTVVGWPVLWPVLGNDPVTRFAAAWQEMKHYHLVGTLLYAGEVISIDALPWHYLPVWIAITTPLPLLGLILFGAGATVWGLARRPLGFWRRDKLRILALACGVGPLVAIVVFGSVVYDGWRHAFFVYPPLLLGGLLSLPALAWRGWGRWMGGALLGFLAVLAGRYHPHQNAYFNRLAGKDLAAVVTRFEVDYWGLSYRQAIEMILSERPVGQVRIWVPDLPGSLNSDILRAEERARVVYVATPEEADFWLTSYRTYVGERPEPDPRFSVRVDGGWILSGYRGAFVR